MFSHDSKSINFCFTKETANGNRNLGCRTIELGNSIRIGKFSKDQSSSIEKKAG